jgi:hypothetical protein
LIPDVCYSQDTYWALDGYDANGCHMTNYMSGAQLYVPKQVTPQNQVCYSPTTGDVLVCGCESEEYTVFYISSSATTNENALLEDYSILFNSGTFIYEDCKLTTLVPSGSYSAGNQIVDFGSGNIINWDPCAVPVPKTVTVHIQNGLAKTTSTTYYSSSFVIGSSILDPVGYTVVLGTFNAQTSSVYNIAQTGYLDMYGEMMQALSTPGCCQVRITVTSGSVVPNSSPYEFYYSDSVGNSYNWIANGLYIDSTLSYNVDIVFTSAYSCL